MFDKTLDELAPPSEELPDMGAVFGPESLNVGNDQNWGDGRATPGKEKD